MTEKLPRGVAGVLNAMGTGWRHCVTRAAGHTEITTLGDPRGDGTRPRVSATAPVDSVCLRAVHPPTGRAVVAVWVCRTDRPKRSWTADMIWRGRHDGEHAPRQLTATQLRAYVADEP